MVGRRIDCGLRQPLILVLCVYRGLSSELGWVTKVMKSSQESGAKALKDMERLHKERLQFLA